MSVLLFPLQHLTNLVKFCLLLLLSDHIATQHKLNTVFVDPLLKLLCDAPNRLTGYFCRISFGQSITKQFSARVSQFIMFRNLGRKKYQFFETGLFHEFIF
ncbi:hypothetical protein AMECASPLE_030883 [Ameca splendens]|uniref:Secreted protein n=1 Tax=Ameca splendens TaxID=208324 RepID=A0ABV1AEM5_9TELE